MIAARQTRYLSLRDVEKLLVKQRGKLAKLSKRRKGVEKKIKKVDRKILKLAGKR